MAIAKRSMVPRGWGEAGMNRWRTEGSQGCDIVSYATITMNMVLVHLSKATECTILTMNPNVIYGLALII